MPPLFAIKIDQTSYPKLHSSRIRSEIAPRPPTSAQDAPPIPSSASGYPPNTSRGSQDRPNSAPNRSNNEKLEIVPKFSNRNGQFEMHDCHSPWSLAMAECRSQQSNPQRVAAVALCEVLFNKAPPQRILNSYCIRNHEFRCEST